MTFNQECKRVADQLLKEYGSFGACGNCFYPERVEVLGHTFYGMSDCDRAWDDCSKLFKIVVTPQCVVTIVIEQFAPQGISEILEDLLFSCRDLNGLKIRIRDDGSVVTLN